MPSRCPAGPAPSSVQRRAAVLLVVAALAVVATACAGSDAAPSAVAAPGTTTSSSAAPATPPPGGATRIGQFVAVCPFSHRSPDDPIVHPHEGGHGVASAHSHDFYGNTATDAHSTPAGLLGAPTTCNLAEDRSSYWTPTLFRGDQPVAAEQFAAYYDTAPGIDPSTAAALPAGLVMIAGNATTGDEPPPGAIGWTCGRSGEPSLRPPSCSFTAPLTLHLHFPDCWDGHRLDSDDHRSHVAYSARGACPATHPMAMIRLLLRIRYPVHGDPSDLRLSSGSLGTAHADFMNAWTDRGMTDLVGLCIRRRVTCGEA